MSGTDTPTAIVTGASRGIGRAIAQALGGAGWHVVVAGRTEAEQDPSGGAHTRLAAGTIHATATAIRAAGGQADAVPCNLECADALERLARSTLERHGRIDALVLNAGIDGESEVAALEPELLDRCLAVNVRAPVLLCRYALPAMLAAGRGAIVGITSGAAVAWRPGRVVYSLTKAALERALLSLAEEVRPAGIAVNLLAPGRVDTWMNRRGDWPGTAHLPMVAPEAVAPAALWLCAQTAATFTGQRVERADFGVSWGPEAGPEAGPQTSS